MPGRSELGRALRALRKERGLTGAELAGRVGVTQTAISRYEVGTRLPSPEVLGRIADALGAPEDLRGQLVGHLHAALTELESNRAIVRRGLGRRQQEIAGIEARASRIRNFATAVMPGLLQTPGYARRIFAEGDLVASPEDEARALAVRLDRQAILHDPAKRFGFLITEPVLFWPRGGVPEMLAQLDRLRSVLDLPNVDLSILPLGVEPPQSPIDSFTIFDEDLVLVGTLTEQLAIRDPDDVGLYVRAWEAFRAASVSGPEARELIASAAERLRQGGSAG